MQWLSNGDKGSKIFFNMLKWKQAKDKIDKLLVEDRDVSNADVILHDFSPFCKLLFSCEESTLSSIVRDKCQSIISKILYPDER